MSGQIGIQEQLRRLAHAYGELSETMLESMDGFTSRGGWEHALQLSTIGLVAKARCTTRAILLLLDQDFVGEAQVLLRVLVELTVIALAIGRRPKERAPLYLNFLHIARYEQWERAATDVALRKALFEEDPRQAGRLKANYEQHRETYTTRKGGTRHKWHRERPRDLAREVDLGDLWNAMYGIDSALVHSGPDCLRLYVRETRPRQLDIGPQAKETRTVRVLLDVTTCMERVLQHFLDVFPSDDGRDQLAQLGRQRQAVFSRSPL